MSIKIAVDVSELYALNFFLKGNRRKHITGLERVIMKQMHRFRNAPGMEFRFCESEDILLSKPSDIIYFPNVPFPPFERKEKLKQKVFFTIHDLTPLYYPESYSVETVHKFKAFIKNLHEEDSFFCVSEFTKEKLCCLGDVNPDNVTVAHLGADHKVFHPAKNTNIKQKLNVPENCRYILAMSSMHPNKNLTVLLKSFINILEQEKINDLCLVIP